MVPRKWIGQKPNRKKSEIKKSCPTSNITEDWMDKCLRVARRLGMYRTRST